MIIGIMQPYFMPYIGYWQLMNAVNKYVIYDDVNFIKGGWINRNRILLNGEAKFFNVQLKGASSNKLINQIGVTQDKEVINKNLRILEAAYKKAPYFDETFPMLKTILLYETESLADYIMHSFEEIKKYLLIDTEFILSSELKKNNNLKGQEKILHICELLGAKKYYNAFGGQELYSFYAFKSRNIELNFLKTNFIEYKQFENEFIPNLSLIDVMMFNSVSEIQKFLQQFNLICDGGEGK